MAEKTLGQVAWEEYCNAPTTMEPDDWQAVADAVVAAHEARRWQPIESAPKDGMKVLIAIPAFNAWPAMVGISHFYKKGRAAGYWWDFAGLTPTHWSPIPAPPKEAEHGA